MGGEIAGKARKLREILGSYGGALVSYSGGVDSTLLAVIAREVLGEGMAAAFISSPLQSGRELARAVELAAGLGFPLAVVETDELSLPGMADNPPERCYICKRHRLEVLEAIARDRGLAAVLDGSNADDAAMRRPGRRAIEERGAAAPLEEAGLTKAEVRELARTMGLPNWDQPSRPCLATRIPYGAELRGELLRLVDEAEAELQGLGIRQVRVRLDVPGEARLEIGADELPAWVGEGNRERLLEKLVGLGFHRILLDLDGYRSGGMDEDVRTRRCLTLYDGEKAS